MSQSPYVTSVFREAVQGFFGGTVTWLCTNCLAGIIATAATAENMDDVNWGWAFAWIGHLAVAGLGIWGLITLCIHAACLGALIYGTERALRVILIAFVAQLTTSSIVALMFNPEMSVRVAIAWLAFATPAIWYLMVGFMKREAE